MEKNPNRTRDHLANERTFLAWIRTAVSLIGLGFVIVKFAVFVYETKQEKGLEITNEPSTHSGTIGIVLILFGAITAILGFISHRNTAKQIEENYFKPKVSFNIIVTAITVLAGIFMAYLLMPK